MSETTSTLSIPPSCAPPCEPFSDSDLYEPTWRIYERGFTQHNLQVVGASSEARVAYNELRYRESPILVLGEERKGLDAHQRSLCEDLVHIPRPMESTLSISR